MKTNLNIQKDIQIKFKIKLIKLLKNINVINTKNKNINLNIQENIQIL